MPKENLLVDLKNLYNSASPIEKNFLSEYLNHIISSGSEGNEYMETLSYYGLLSDNEIASIKDLIDPFVATKVTACTYSYGLEPFGYTATLSNTFIDLNSSIKTVYERIVLEPKVPYLVSTVETFNFPISVAGHIYIKSSIMRQGIIGCFSPIEPGYKGNLSFLVINLTSKPIGLPANQGIAQVQFTRPSSVNNTTYAGKYQNSSGTVENRSVSDPI